MPPSRSAAAFVFPAPDLDARHDPGHAAAAERGAAALAGAPPTPIRLRGGGLVRVGTASWTDPTLLRAPGFYPPEARSAEARLRHYAATFPLVEVDSSYYALPTAAMAERWVERTPPHFRFDVKAHALMTGQPSEPRRLPADLHLALPPALAGARRVYAHQLPAELADELWTRFLDALAPLRAAGRLGAVLLQYPHWVRPSHESAALLRDARRRLGDVPGAVEFRHARWFHDERRTRRVLDFLAELGLAHVIVDAPPDTASSVPPVVAATVPSLAVVRLHGRRTAAWEARGQPVVERYRYLYDEGQLGEWVARIVDVARQAQGVHVLFNNCHGNYGVVNAAEFATRLERA